MTNYFYKIVNYARENGFTEMEIERLMDEIPSDMTEKEYNDFIFGIDCELEYR